MNFAAVNTFVTSKLLPAITAITAAIPGLLSTTEADVQAAIVAITKVLTDLQSDIVTLANAVKSAS